MSEFLSFDAHGDLYLTMPPAELVRARKTGPEAFTVEFGRPSAAVDLAWMLTVQATLTRALCEAGYGHEVTTPETLAKGAGL